MRCSLPIALLSVLCACGPQSGSDAGAGPDAVVVDTRSGRDDVGAADAGPVVDNGPVGIDAPAPPDAGARPDVGGPDATASDGGTPRTFALPPVNGGLDYQLGGAYAPPAGVTIVSRDRNAAPAAGLYNICYVNGFQIQPDEVAFWMTSHPDLILRDARGNPVIDRDWNEMLIDISTPAKRTAVAAVVADWIQGCARRGFVAVEIDNLDSFSRSGGLLTVEHAVATMRLFSAASHAAGLAIAQKNSVEIVRRRAEMGTDFAVAEECNRYSECGGYTAGYGDHVLVIEYRRADFTTGCAAYPNLSIVLRDRNLVAPGNPAYVRDGC